MHTAVTGVAIVPWAKEALRSGLIAGLAMIPFGMAFRAMGYRINEYGLKVVDTLFGHAPGGARFALFVGEHFLISCLAAPPLLLALRATRGRISALLTGAAYGAGFYAAVNSLALPWLYGDPTPWQLGWPVVYPSLTVHLVYGLSIALTSRGFVRR